MLLPVGGKTAPAWLYKSAVVWRKWIPCNEAQDAVKNCIWSFHDWRGGIHIYVTTIIEDRHYRGLYNQLLQHEETQLLFQTKQFELSFLGDPMDAKGALGIQPNAHILIRVNNLGWCVKLLQTLWDIVVNSGPGWNLYCPLVKAGSWSFLASRLIPQYFWLSTSSLLHIVLCLFQTPSLMTHHRTVHFYRFLTKTVQNSNENTLFVPIDQSWRNL